jgi:hypothetical protein
MYQFNTISFSWTELNTNIIGTPPCARSYLGFASLNEILYVYGGWNGDGVPHSKPCLSQSLIVLTLKLEYGCCCCDVRVFSKQPSSMSAQVHSWPNTRAPQTRVHIASEFNYCATTAPSPGWILTARPWPGAIADLHAFDPARREWTDLSGAGGAVPPARAFHGFTALAGHLYVFGGCDCFREHSRLFSVRLYTAGPLPLPSLPPYASVGPVARAFPRRHHLTTLLPPPPHAQSPSSQAT